MPRYNDPDETNLIEIIRQLEKRVDDLERRARGERMSIDNGALMVKKDDTVLATLGDLAEAGYTNLTRPDGTAQMGYLLRRDTGELVMAVWDPDPVAGGYQQFWALYDRTGTVVVSDDTTAGWGLATPYIPSTGWSPPSPSNWVSNNTTTYATVDEAWIRVQHPKMRINVVGYAEASVPAAMRWLINGDQPTSSQTWTGAGYNTMDEVVSIDPALQGEYVQLELQVRKTSTATGLVMGKARYAYGRQS